VTKLIDINDSIKRSITQQLKKLEEEEKQLNREYENKMRVASDDYYVSYARNKAKQEALKSQNRLDEIVSRKLELMRELNNL
jgi:hypothetical protein